MYSKLIIAVLIITAVPVYAVMDWVEQSPAFEMPVLDSHSMVFDMAREVSFLYLGGVYIYNGSDWEQLFPAGDIPPVRFNFGMAYDSAREVTVVFGGSPGVSDYLGDTWEWDGFQWEQKYPLESPPDRAVHSMTYFPSIDAIVLFGGTEDTIFEPLNDTWLWDGTEWTKVETAHAPVPRGATDMCYFSSMDGCVLFGGSTGGKAWLDDTWIFDGADWTELTVDHHPSGRYWHTLVEDTARGKVVLFGGLPVGGDYSGETWEFDGNDWTQIETNHAPSDRCLHAACYDSVRERIVLFGGLSYSGPRNDTWEYYDAPPTATPTSTPTATPTATPICHETGVNLTMPAHNFTPGSPCSLTATLCNLTDDHLQKFPFFCILDIAGQYWFHPGWSQSTDYETILFLARNLSVDIVVIPEFIWPDTAQGSARFLSAMTDPEISTVTGEIGIWEFSWE